MIWCFTKKQCMRHDAWAGMLMRWSCQSPVAHSCGLLNHPNSFHRGMFKFNAKFDADSVILNVMTTQYTCSLNGAYHPHWLVQWRHHCSCMCIPIYSSWLPGYSNVTQTVLVILTMAGLFPDRPCIGKWICWSNCVAPVHATWVLSLSCISWPSVAISWILHCIRTH